MIMSLRHRSDMPTMNDKLLQFIDVFRMGHFAIYERKWLSVGKDDKINRLYVKNVWEWAGNIWFEVGKSDNKKNSFSCHSKLKVCMFCFTKHLGRNEQSKCSRKKSRFVGNRLWLFNDHDDNNNDVNDHFIKLLAADDARAHSA